MVHWGWQKSAQWYDIMAGVARFQKNAAFVAKVLKKYKVKSVLELGCGSGLYLFPLKKSGFDIEGLDISKQMLKEARKISKKVRLYQKDMCNFKINKKYDAILILNSSLALLPNQIAMEKTLIQCHKHLKEDGILMIDLPNHRVEIPEENFAQYHQTYKSKLGTLEHISRSFKKGNKWIETSHGFVKGGKSYSEFTDRFEELIFSPRSFEKALKSKFKLLSMYGSRKGGKFFERKSYRRVYLCKKA